MMAESENNQSQASRNVSAEVPPTVFDDPLDKKHGLFYRRVESSPCLVHAFKNSIFIGIGVSLFTYLITTSPRKAALWAWGSYFVSQYPLWYFCNYEERKKDEEAERYEKMMFGRVMMEGTDYEKELDKLIEEKERQGALKTVSNNPQTADKKSDNGV